MTKIWNKKLHIFNPGHETAVLTNQVYYTPTANVRTMQRDLALLPIWYGETKDQVYVEDTPDLLFLSALQNRFKAMPRPITGAELASSPLPLDAAPWGISPQILHKFKDIRQRFAPELHVPEWKDAYRTLTGRQTAIACLDAIRERLNGLMLPDSPLICSSIDEVLHYSANHTPPFVVKTPYSSSGRGLLWLRTPFLPPADIAWINRAIRKQGFVSIEKGLDKIQDFAMEFYRDEQGEITYKGLSVFETAEKGNYSGNRIKSQQTMRNALTATFADNEYERVKEAVSAVLREAYTPYTGLIGVDMMVYRDKSGIPVIHPCVEINMRNTMGMVSIRLFEQYVHLKAQGRFFVSYDKEAYTLHRQMESDYPLVVEEGRIVKGYLSLCPVSEQTVYRAYLLISPPP